MKFALIGNGFIAPKHIEAIKLTGGELVAVADVNPSKEIKDIPFFLDYRDAIKEADAVSICTPNYLHPEMIRNCKGKKILCEKPISFKLYDFEELKQVPNLFGNFQLRHLPSLPRMRKQAKEAKTAHLKVEMKRSGSYYQSWKGDKEKSGGLLVNIGCHYFDLIGHLFGYAGFLSIIDHQDELTAKGRLVYPKTTVYWEIGLTSEQEDYERSLVINHHKFNLVQPSNLHIRTYEDFMWGHGIKADEEEKIMKMIYVISGL